MFYSNKSQEIIRMRGSSRLSQKQSDQLCRQIYGGEVRTLCQGDVVFKQGSECDDLYVVKTGIVELYSHDCEKLIMMGVAEPGDMFGEIDGGERHRRQMTARAQTFCEVYVVSKEKLKPFLRQSHPLVRKMLRSLLSKARILQEHIKEFAFPNKPILSMASMLVLNAKACRSHELLLADLVQSVKEISMFPAFKIDAILAQMQDLNLIKINRVNGKLYVYVDDNLVSNTRKIMNRFGAEIENNLKVECETIDVSSAAELVGVDPSQLYSLICSGELSESMLLVKKSLLEDFCRENAENFSQIAGKASRAEHGNEQSNFDKEVDQFIDAIDIERGF
jgi:hypothetical protein